MIRYQFGDLLEAEEAIIVHQVNCQGVMGAGIAAQIRKKWPEVYRDYIFYFNGHRSRPDLLGEVRFTMIKKENYCKYIASLFGQENYGRGGRFTNYEALYEGLEHIAFVTKALKKKSVAMPKIGCGLAGGEWKIVEAMIETLFKDIEVVVYIN